MALDFVIETPQKRGINRNNNKLIQKRATQAGARTRSKLKSKAQTSSETSTDSPLSSLGSEVNDIHVRPSTNGLLANAGLTSEASSPFFSRFGDGGQLVCPADSLGMVSVRTLPTSNFSTLQARLFMKLGSPLRTAPDANQVFKILNLTQAHILKQLPSRYGHVSFLDHAIECLIARFDDFLPVMKSQFRLDGKVSTSQLYGRALNSLRTAITHFSENQLNEIWFATLLLTLSELLAGDDEPGWVYHAAGAARLLHKIGPARIRSEFQLSLLPIQCKNMVVETIIGNKACYLGEPSWQSALKSSILSHDDRLGVRSRCSVELWCLGAQIPSLFQSVADYTHQRLSSRHSAVKVSLEKLLSEFTRWEEVWSTKLQDVLEDPSPENTLYYDANIIMMAFFMLHLLVHRLRIALDPWKTLHLEVQVLEMCAGIFHLQSLLPDLGEHVVQQNLVASQFALGTEKTTHVWRDEILDASPDTPIDALVFDEWCDAIGRQKEPVFLIGFHSPESTP